MRPELAREPEIAALADEQHGVVTRAQLVEMGFTDGGVARRVRARRLHRLHRGVYAVGHRVLTVEGRWMAATLATGGVLSHASAAAAWELRHSNAAVIHVTIAGDSGRARRKGLRVHRSLTLRPHDATVHRGVPVTTAARTIIDLAKHLNGRPLEHLIDLADQRRLIDFGELREYAVPSLQAVLQNYNPAPTRSELEERFLRLCDDHGLPRPETNTVVEGMTVDFVWRDERLIVEVDGYAYHRSPTAFETDRERDVRLTIAGWRVLRFTWRQISGRPTFVAMNITGARALVA